MNLKIDLLNPITQSITVIEDRETAEVGAVEGKGWSFINVYSLIELRNIYLAMVKSGFDGDLSKFSDYCDTNLPYERKPWSYRKVEEYINALRNFKILSKDNHLIQGIFKDQDIQNELSTEDKAVLKKIYYSYFRFKEIHTWFTNISASDRKQEVINFSEVRLREKSEELYSFSRSKRFTDSFFVDKEDLFKIYILDDSSTLNRRMMRFWHVYVTWGRLLGVLEKVNIDPLNTGGIQTAISCSYHIEKDVVKCDLVKYVKSKFGNRKTFIPEIVFKFAMENRISIRLAKEFILEQYQKNRDKFSIDNTSEIFIEVARIDKEDNLLYPLYRGSYISHLTLLQ
ncbi:MAG TPA: hypothetical protein VK622_04635 [Puia sp.]|nr:hypothetical protein [Puia sp.]